MAYLPRLVCISLATYFLVHLAIGAIVTLIAGPAVHLGERIRPHLAARCVLALRLLPAACAALMVLVVCVPSYLLLEPAAPAERVGFGCLAAAILGGAMWAFSLSRGMHAATGSLRFVRQCRRIGVEMDLPEAQSRTWALNGDAPLLALGGVVRPHLVISRGVMSALSAEELAVALRHERAHWTARDNLKRMCMLLAPSVLPFTPSSQTLERGWRKFAEWTADDRAVAGNARRSFALAAALVRVARMTGSAAQLPRALSLLGDNQQLSARVERLLRAAPVSERARRPQLGLTVSALLLLAASLAAMLHPATLYSVHLALEHLIE